MCLESLAALSPASNNAKRAFKEISTCIHNFASTVEPQSYKGQVNWLTGRKVDKAPNYIPVVIRLRMPTPRIAAAAMLFAPFTMENNPKEVYGGGGGGGGRGGGEREREREHSCSNYNCGLWAFKK